MMEKLTLLVCITLGCVFFAQIVRCDKCRRKVPLEPAFTCGPEQSMYNIGECLCCYKNAQNIPTIGIGFNLRSPGAAQVLSNYNLNLSDVLQDCRLKTTNYCLTDDQAKDIFNTVSYPAAISCVDNFAPGLPPIKRAAIIDVALVGCNKLKKLKKLQQALALQDWETAAKILKNSNLCKQKVLSRKRCNSDVNCLLSSEPEGCTGQICGTFNPDCSLNPDNPNCYCFKTQNGTGFCGIDFFCEYPDCTDCPPDTSVCIVDTCCAGPQCAPLTLGDTCKAPPNVCTGQVCGTFNPNCSSNPLCYCFKTQDGTGFCGLDFSCGQPDCTDCPSDTSVCIVDTCCGTPQCVPKTIGETCQAPPTEVCTGQVCGTFNPNCSSNPDCYCFKTQEETGFCAVDFFCEYPDCTDCPSDTSVCIVDTCCGTPQCVPKTLGETCQAPPTRVGSKSKSNYTLNSSQLNSDFHKVGTAVSGG